MSPFRAIALLLTLALVTLLVGGTLIGQGLREQYQARGALSQLRVAVSNLELIVDQRVDEALGQVGLHGFADPDEAVLAARLDLVREMAPDTAGDLALVAELDERLSDADTRDVGPVLLRLSLVLDRVAHDALASEVDRLDAAETRTWRALLLTGAAALGLVGTALVIHFRRAPV